MTTYDWHTIRTNTIARFGGDTPRAELEHRILQIFQQHPQLVTLAIDKIAASYTNGTVRSPWAVLATHIERAATPSTELVVDDTSARHKRIQKAEQWIKAAGMHFDNQDEIILELFDSGKLLNGYAQAELHRLEDRTWTIKTAGDTALIDRMTTVWQQHRPTGQQLEHEATERAERWKTQHASTSQNSAPKPNASPQDSTPSAKSTATISSPSSTSPKPPASASKQTPTSGIPPTRSRTTSAPAASPASADDDLPL